MLERRLERQQRELERTQSELDGARKLLDSIARPSKDQKALPLK